jgi:hypothetical protein
MSNTAPSCVTGSDLNEAWTGCVSIANGTTLAGSTFTDVTNAGTACVLATKKIWSGFTGTTIGNCNTATGCADAAGETPSTLCTTVATGCEVTLPATMAGHCTLLQPADEIGRVYAVPAKTTSCKTACHETLEVIAVNKVEEACNVERPVRVGLWEIRKRSRDDVTYFCFKYR